MIEWIIFVLTAIYTVSFAIYELKNGNKTSFVAVLSVVIISIGLFMEYLT